VFLDRSRLLLLRYKNTMGMRNRRGGGGKKPHTHIKFIYYCASPTELTAGKGTTQVKKRQAEIIFIFSS
jgi:hypothetical protein